MSGRRLEGVAALTFDVWSTLFRSADTGPQQPLALRRWADLHCAAAGDGALEEAIAAATALSLDQWRQERQLGLRGMVAEVVTRLRGEAAAHLCAALEQLLDEADAGRTLEVAPAALDTLTALRRAGLRIGVVSDTGWTSGRQLRRHLGAAGLLDLLEPAALAFSDEVGCPKPAAGIFLLAARGLDAAPECVVHVGDLRRTDVAGARAAGMRTIRYRGLHDDEGEGCDADFVVDDLAEITRMIGR